MLLLGGSLSLCAQSKYPPIEELVYTGYYNWGFIWVKAGRVDFSLTTSEKYPNAERLKAVGYSLPSWDWIFTIRDTLISHFDKNTFMPYEFSRKAHEGNYPVSYTHLRAHETLANLVCRLLLEKIFFNDTATTEIYTLHIVGSVRCV